MLQPLFDAELDYQPGMSPLTSEGDGTLIGSGDGAVHGPKLTGALEWTLFEQPGSTMCAMAPVARIITGDGAASGSKAAATAPAAVTATRSGGSRRPSTSPPATAATPGSTAHWPCGKASSTRSPTAPSTRPSFSQLMDGAQLVWLRPTFPPPHAWNALALRADQEETAEPGGHPLPDAGCARPGGNAWCGAHGRVTLRPWRSASAGDASPGPIRACWPPSFALLMNRCG